jgi:capsular exopolysaccharide synthesis family protein
VNTKVTLPNEPNEASVEAYRTLRTNIQFCNADKTIRTICITSCIPNEGKSTASTNLTISLASADKKVLLIDADMRKPRYYKELSMKYNMGLSNYLSGMAEFDDVISETNIDNVQIILCGPKPPNPAELISTAKFREMLDRAEERYDYIIIDTPPIGSMIDAAVIASKVDGTILLIEANKIDYKREQRVKEQLEKANAKIMGVVLNKIPKKDFKDQYYYYNNYYYGRKRGRKIEISDKGSSANA